MERSGNACNKQLWLLKNFIKYRDMKTAISYGKETNRGVTHGGIAYEEVSY
jgi:hypothetical protein